MKKNTDRECKCFLQDRYAQLDLQQSIRPDPHGRDAEQVDRDGPDDGERDSGQGCDHGQRQWNVRHLARSQQVFFVHFFKINSLDTIF